MSTRNTVGPLSESVERHLLNRMSAGDQDARCRLIEAYLGMVSALARRYAKRWKVPSEDLMQEGALALVQAVDHYDYRRGMKLSTYATWWVKQAIRRAAMTQSRPVRVPERLWQMAGELSYELSVVARGHLGRVLGGRVGEKLAQLARTVSDPGFQRNHRAQGAPYLF